MKRLLILLTIFIFSCSTERVEEVDLYADCKATIPELDKSMADPRTGLIEFDIIPPIQRKGSATSKSDLLWDKGIVPYIIKGSEKGINGTRLGIDREEDKEKIRAALAELSSATGILFPEYESAYDLTQDQFQS